MSTRIWAIACVLTACNGKLSAPGPQQKPTVSPDLTPPMGSAAELVPNPTAPVTEDGRTLTWSSAPLLDGVTVVPNRDSLIIEVPAVEHAVDYRVFRLDAGVSLDGTQVMGGVVHCAGYRQRNAEAPAARELLRQIEVTGLDARSILVVEAVDQPCPFPGLLGRESKSITVTNDEVPPADRVTFGFFTADEIAARYGSLIRNGHGNAATLAQPADVALARPQVLARTGVYATPLGVAAAPPTDFFDDFANDMDQPVFVRPANDHRRSQRGKLYQNTRWSFYSYGAIESQMFIERGQLQSVIADWEQDIFATNIAYPRQVVHLDDNSYLKVVFDVPSDSTSRRYWWMFVCGSQTAGATMNDDGTLIGDIVQTSFFYQPDGRNPSVVGWNCFQLFPRDGWPFDLAPDDTRPESDVRVMVNTANAGERDNVVNVSPPQYKNAQVAPPSWYRQQEGQTLLTGPMLDDQLLISPRSRIAIFLRRDRVVMFVNGKQRLCNDFPTHKLTMAEGALGFGQVLYHTTAERLEFSRDYWLRTGQRYYLENTPYADARSWDNLGFSEHAPIPAELDESKCYRAP